MLVVHLMLKLHEPSSTFGDLLIRQLRREHIFPLEERFDEEGIEVVQEGIRRFSAEPCRELYLSGRRPVAMLR